MRTIVEKLYEAHRWMREPDNAETFTTTDLCSWLNRRQTMLYKQAAQEIERLQKEVDRLSSKVSSYEATVEEPTDAMVSGACAEPVEAPNGHLSHDEAWNVLATAMACEAGKVLADKASNGDPGV